MLSFVSTTIALLAASASLVSAAPAKRDSSFKPKSFATTGWGGSAGNSNSGVRLYYSTKGGIQEVVMANGGLVDKDKPKFKKGSYLQPSNGCSIPEGTPMAASNTYPFGGDGVQVYYLAQCGQNKTIMNFEYSGGSWRTGGLAIQAPAFDMNTRMSVNAYPMDGGYAISLFYSQGGGFIQEFRRSTSDFWTWQGDVGKINSGVEFTSQITYDGKGKFWKNIWTADNANLWWSTDSAKWTTVYGQTHYLANHIASAQIGGQTHFYVTSGTDRNIYEWIVENGAWKSDSNNFSSVTDTPGSKIDTAVQTYSGKTWIYIFYLNKSGSMAMSWYNGKKWSKDDHKVQY